MQDEVWKDCKHYEGLYQVSNYGRVRSVDRTVTYKNGSVHTYKGSYLKLRINKKGYFDVILTKYGIKKHELVHRLVAMAFIPNPDNKPQINHKDEDKQNNYVENLEWVTCKENINYGNHSDKVSKSQGTKVYCDGIIFDSAGKCAKYYNLSRSAICFWLTKKRKMPQNFIDMGLSYAY